MATPHIEAEKGAFANTVLMPGDPLRAKFIAETFLDDVKCVNKVRGMLGFTGKYKGRDISVMGSGMGMPSIGIYSYELFSMYDVENIIRIGSAGALDDKVQLRDVVIAQGACTNSDFSSQYGLPGKFAPIASYELVERAVEEAKKIGAKYWVGNVLSSDTFYDADENSLSKWASMGVLAVEMEAAALYMNAAKLRKKALGIMTISDYPLRGLATTSEEREKTFIQMMEIALNI